ncbi:MAG: hypothetical protein ACREAC_11565, partial [Blastocatellia bacterium]
EAKRIIDFVLRSPLAKNRPQWHDTKLELAIKPRLAFSPFVMALGSPVQHRLQNELEAEPNASERDKDAQTDSQAKAATECEPYRVSAAHVISSQSQELRRAVVVCSARTKDSTITPRATQFAIQPGKNVPRLSFQPIYADRGYAVSPPARAPPARLRNLQTL